MQTWLPEELFSDVKGLASAKTHLVGTINYKMVVQVFTVYPNRFLTRPGGERKARGQRGDTQELDEWHLVFLFLHDFISYH